MHTKNQPPAMSLARAGVVLSIMLSTWLAQGASIYKADVADNLNLATSWTNGVAPGTSDIAVWNNIVQVNTTSALGANLSWAGIQILDPAGPITVSSGNTLTLGASGVDLSLATNNLTLANSNILAAAQTWTVTNGLTLTVSGGISGSGILLTKNGNGTLNLSGAGSYSGGTVVNGGILQISAGTGAGSGAVTNNPGTTLRINTTTTLANVFNFNGPVTIDLNNVGGNQGLGSPGAISGTGTVTFVNQNTGNRTFTLGGSSSSLSGFSGTMELGTNNGTFRFNDGGGNGNTGSSAATFDLGSGTVAFFTRNKGAAVNFGALFGGATTRITNGSSSSGISTYTVGAKNIPCEFDGIMTDAGTSTAGVALTKTGTSIFTLTGSNTYFGPTTISSGTLQVGNGGTSGQVGVGAIVNNSTLIYDRTDNFTVPNGVSGSGNLIQEGGGILTYAGTNTSSGSLLVNTGTVAVAATALVACPVFINSNCVFDVTANPAFAFNQALSGFGSVAGAASFIGGSLNPGGSGVAGTLTFENGLTESGGVTHQMELPTSPGSNDAVNVVGDLTISGTNAIVISSLGSGTILSGTYVLFTYSGNFNGGLTNFSLTVSGVSGTLINPPNEIAVVITPSSRGPQNLTWVGDGVANDWDTSSSNWVSGATSYSFQAGDSVLFNNTGAANSTVTLSSPAPLLPAAVTVNAANNYTLQGIGVIGGSTSLFKTNSGVLSVQTTNTYTGPTIVGQGTLEITSIANGNAPSSLGASSSSPTNLVLNGSTLRYIGGNASSDRGATLLGTGGAFEIPTSSQNLTLSTTPLSGSGGLTLMGAGTLTFDVPNTYAGGTVLSNGVLALGANTANFDGNTGSGVGPTNEPVTFEGGTLQLFGYGGSTANNYNGFYSPLVVPAGQTGTVRMFPRGPANSGANSGLESPLTGSGTLNVVANYVRDNIDGNWSAFTGVINVTSKNGGDEFRINNNFGYAAATVVLNDNVLMDRVSTANSTIDIGELDGTTLASIGQGNGSAAAPTWRVGWKNTTSTFAGTIAADASIIKVGTGTWVLSGQNTFTGSTVISNGVLMLTNGVNGDGSIDDSSNINVTAGAVLDVSGRSDGTLQLGNSAMQVLAGRGIINGQLNVGGSGFVSAGDGLAGNLGTLTVTNTISLNGTAWMKLNRASSPNSDRLVSLAGINFGGTLVVTNAGARLQPGDTFTLFNAAGGFNSTSFGAVNLPGYYTWDTSQLLTSGKITVTGVAPPPAISSVDFSQLASSGTLTFNFRGGTPNGVFNLLSSTNLALPLNQWTQVTTGNFDSSGNWTGLSVTADPAAPQVYFIIQGL